MAVFERNRFAYVVTGAAVAALTVVQAVGAAETELSLALDNVAQVEAHNVTVRAVDYRRGPSLEGSPPRLRRCAGHRHLCLFAWF